LRMNIYCCIHKYNTKSTQLVKLFSTPVEKRRKQAENGHGEHTAHRDGSGSGVLFSGEKAG
jgi:hypothetical protein